MIAKLILSGAALATLAGCGEAAASTPPVGSPAVTTPTVAAAVPVATRSPLAKVTAAPTAKPVPAAPKVLTTMSGSGTKTGPTFNTTGDWTINYSFSDCSGGDGIFQIYVYTDGSIGDVAANVGPALSGHDTNAEHTSGKQYLQVNSTCQWTVTATAN